jgi:hypothetical protein
MNENDSELTTICSQLKMQLGGDKLSPFRNVNSYK